MPVPTPGTSSMGGRSSRSVGPTPTVALWKVAPARHRTAGSAQRQHRTHRQRMQHSARCVHPPSQSGLSAGIIRRTGRACSTGRTGSACSVRSEYSAQNRQLTHQTQHARRTRHTQHADEARSTTGYQRSSAWAASHCGTMCCTGRIARQGGARSPLPLAVTAG